LVVAKISKASILKTTDLILIDLLLLTATYNQLESSNSET